MIKGEDIKQLLRDLETSLMMEGLDATYFESMRKVPCVKVFIQGFRYQFTFFGKSQKFRLFFHDQTHIDLATRDEVVEFLTARNKVGY